MKTCVGCCIAWWCFFFLFCIRWCLGALFEWAVLFCCICIRCIGNSKCPCSGVASGWLRHSNELRKEIIEIYKLQIHLFSLFSCAVRNVYGSCLDVSLPCVGIS